MSRVLTATEFQTLAQLKHEIDRIVALATKTELDSTDVLDGLDPAPDYTVFHARFQRLGGRLAELLALKLVRVEEGLDPLMEANTLISRGAKVELQQLQLRPGLLAEPNQRSLTSRALTLLHELSHALEESPIFPVKDYAYRDGWAWGYLPASLAANNADTYAEAAAQIAERAQQRPGRYQELGRVPAQRHALAKLRGATDLGAALALADLQLNRAWLRANDANSVAQSDFGNLLWPSTLAGWKKEPDYTGLLRIEAALHSLGLIGERVTGLLSTGLDQADKTTVSRIYRHLAALKGALAGAEPVPVLTGTTVVYQPATGRLEIPRAVAGLGVVNLADLIIDALIAGKPAAEPLPKGYPQQCRAVVDLMVDNDRPGEKAALDLLRAHFAAIRPTAPTPARWAELANTLGYAELVDIRVRWARLAGRTPELAAGPAAERSVLETVSPFLSQDLDRALALGRQLPGNEEELRKLAASLATIRAAAVAFYPKEAASYDALQARLQP
ncbi:hypothetical protein ABT095_07065 [Kitasatospora sp. NPDC002227]|uniref:hypothetical protein n=1 Tax=Kitasatospora sp. NPDC002227 TaxID=3154773 RepID=UPI003332A1DC